MIVLPLLKEIIKLVLNPHNTRIGFGRIGGCLHLLEYPPLPKPLTHILRFRFVLLVVGQEGLVNLVVALAVVLQLLLELFLPEDVGEVQGGGLGDVE